MTEELTLNYGGRELTLKRSNRFVALRPSPGMEGALQQTMITASDQTSHVTAPGQALGGFMLVDIGRADFAMTDRKLDQMRLDPAVAAGTHVFEAVGGDSVPIVPTGELYVRFKPQTEAAAKRDLFDRFHLQVMEGRDDDTTIARTTLGSPNPVATAIALQASEVVEAAEPNLATPGQLCNFQMPNDPLLAEQWHLRNLGRYRGDTTAGVPGADARVLAAWNASGNLGAPPIVVAVIDDGFDLSHPDLSGPGKQIRAWDFTRGNDQPLPDPNGSDWHGTACAGVAVGRVGGGNIVGAAPGASLMPVRWGPDISDAQIESWFDYVGSQGASVVSCSWKARASFFLLGERGQQAIARCARQGRGGLGCVIVFAAGNDNASINNSAAGSVNGFAIHPDVIAVAASTSRDQRADYSNFGDEIWVCAPSSGAGGWGILTTDVRGKSGYSPGDYTFDFGGTSSACPLVAGICALVLSVNPGLTAPQVRDILRTTARRIGDAGSYVDGRSRHFGFGCVNAEAAVRKAIAMKHIA